jgi:hypothetical protein
MGIFILISGGLTCAFFLYVLVQFHRELERIEGGRKGRPDGKFRGYTRQLSARQAEQAEKKIKKILKITRERGEMRREKRAEEKSNNSGGVPYVETVFPIGFVVTPVLSAAGDNGNPSK